MMKIIEQFKISGEVYFDLSVPELAKKFNFYYPPSEKINKFDEVTVALLSKDEPCEVVVDMLQTIVSALYSCIKRALKNEIPLPLSIKAGELGKLYNIEYYQDQWLEDEEQTVFSIDYNTYWLWSSLSKVQSWIYNRDNKIYLEVGRSHSSIFSATAIRDDKKFEKYINNFKPILFVEISHHRAQEWLQKCEKIIHDIDSEYVLDVDKNLK